MNGNADRMSATGPTALSALRTRLRHPSAVTLAVAVTLLMVLSALATVGVSAPAPRAAAPAGPSGSLSHAGVGLSALAMPGDTVLSEAAYSDMAARLSGVGGGLANPLLAHVSPVYRPIPVGSALSGLRASGLSPSAVSFGPSTGSNWYIMDHSYPGSIAQLGSSNQSLIMAGYGIGGVFNGSTFINTHGTMAISTSSTGGQSWTTDWPGQNASWTLSTNKDYSDIMNGGVGTVGSTFPELSLFNPIDTAGAQPVNTYPQVVLNSSHLASNVVVVGTYGPPCGIIACTNSQFGATSGLAAVRSVDGGKTWLAPTPITTGSQWEYIANWPGGCNQASGGYIVPAVQTSSFAVAEGGSNHLVAMWASNDWFYPGGRATGLLFCNTTVSPNILEYGWAAVGGGVAYNLSVSTSANGGVSWSAPQVLASYFQLASKGFYYQPPNANPTLTVGPAPGYAFTALYTDLLNSSSTTGAIPFASLHSSNNGVTWSKAAASGVSANWMRYSGPDWFYNYSQAHIATDNWSASSYKGHEYMVWNDNRTGAAGSGYPSIAVSVNASTSWGTPVFVSTNNPASSRYFMPSVAVQPNGRVWITYYGANVNNGNYRVYGVYSDNGGASWSAQFAISDAASTPGVAPNAMDTAAPAAAVGTSAGMYVTWIDCRATGCTSNLNTSSYAALVIPTKLSTNAPNLINVTVSLGGFPTVYPLTGPAGSVVLAWNYNSSISLSVPSGIPTPNGSYIEEFQSYSGAVASTSNPATFLFTGGNVVIHYQLVAGAWIDGSITPVIAGTVVRIQGQNGGSTILAKITAVGGAYDFNQTVAGGLGYYVNVSAPKYNASSQLVPTVVLKPSAVTVSLGKVVGWIAGSVSPKNAKVVVEDSVGGAPGYPTLSANGHFNVSRVWGSYYVNASLPGYKNCSVHMTVFPGQTNATGLTPCFLWGSHIAGTITPANANLTIDGASVTTSAGTFNQSLPGGNYQVSAHLFGYSGYSQLVSVAIGANKTLTIVITNKGWISGSVLPTTAVVSVNLQPQTVIAGSFNFTELGSDITHHQAFLNYTVTAQAIGYDTQTVTVKVTPGNATPVKFVLNLTKVPPQPQPYCTIHPTASNCTSGTKSTDYTLVYVGVAVIVVLVAVIAVVLMMRRGKGGASAPPADAPGAGPMDGGGSPPPPP